MSFKVVQLTDTHLFQGPEQTQKGVNTYESLQAVVADVASNHPDFDALLLTGDLSQDESAESYETLKQLLSPIRTSPVYAIPGNHDDLRRMQAQLVDADMSVMEDFQLGNWRFVMLNSQVPGRVHGELGQTQVARVRDSLGEHGEHTIIVLHHPPVGIASAWLDASCCLDGDELLNVIADPPVKAVVCGHVHQTFETTHEGVAVLTTPSTCVQFKPGSEDFAVDAAAPGYRVFRLEADGRWETRVHRID